MRCLKKQREAGIIPPRFATEEQATRVAWRIAKDWLEAAFAMVAMEMADLDEVLLPYQLQSGRSFFEWYVESRPSLPGPNGSPDMGE